MTQRQQSPESLAETFEQREPGVAELFEFFSRIEEVYVASSQGLEHEETGRASNSTNAH